MPFVVHSVDILSGKTTRKSFKKKVSAIKYIKRQPTSFVIRHIPRTFEYKL